MKRSKLILFGIFTAVLLLIAATPSFSKVSLKIRSITNTVTADYYMDNKVQMEETIVIKHKGDATDFFLTFSAGSSGDFFNRTLSTNQYTDTLNYQLYKTTSEQRVLKDLTGAASDDDVITGYFEASQGWQEMQVTYVYSVPKDQFIPKANYSDSIDVTLYEGTLSSWVEQASKRVTLKADVWDSVQVSIVPTGQPFNSNNDALTLDFGFFEEGESMSADIVVRSNTLFSISFLSINGGVMVYSGGTDSSVVPYEFTFNGAAASLAGDDVLIDQGPTDESGLRYPFTITILPYGWVTGGPYKDTVTVTVSVQ